MATPLEPQNSLPRDIKESTSVEYGSEAPVKKKAGFFKLMDQAVTVTVQAFQAVASHASAPSQEQQIDVMIQDFEKALQQTDFVTLCQVVHNQMFTLKFEDILDKKQIATLKRAAIQLKEKEITINIFAQCNTGKSTLLNAIMGEKFLPVRQVAETGLSVMIQHSDTIHHGVCPVKCTNTKTCPHLEVKYKGKELETVFGVKEIQERIQKENKKQRKSTTGNVKRPPELILKTNIPLIAENVLKGWCVTLVDNPGLGEAKEHIVQAINVSWESSAAYVYLTSAQNIAQKAEAETFKAFHAKELLSHGRDRLVIALTRYDEVLNCVRGEQPVTLDEIQRDICECVKDVTNGQQELLPASILPVSGRWALACSSLSNCLGILDEKEDEFIERLEYARGEISKMMDFACGQDWMKTKMEQMSPQQLIEKLTEASKIDHLKKRLAMMVRTSCIKIWATSVFGSYKSALNCGRVEFENRIHKLTTEVKGKEGEVVKLHQKLSTIKAETSQLKATLKQGSGTTIWKRLEKSYPEDIKDGDAVQMGIRLCEEEVKNLKTFCRTSIEEPKKKTFTKGQLEEAMDVWLSNTERVLQEKYNSLNFPLLHGIISEASADAAVQIANLQNRLSNSMVTDAKSDELQSPEGGSVTKAVPPPTLGNIKDTVQIPDVSLGHLSALWEKFMGLFTRWRSSRRASETDVTEQSDTGADSEKDTNVDTPYRRWDPSLDKIMDDMLQGLKEECKRYVDIIQQSTLQYFYKLYTQSVKKRLDRFDYNRQLKAEDKILQEMMDDEEELKVSLSEVTKVNAHIIRLEEELKQSHDAFVAELPMLEHEV